ncbi:hypothetical protein PROFUN_01668 [Planoprotostelium fungivorum]|uniref:Chromo domain-containing protein n=1 Tax=Planoprotostelium fungivorum TaxID=1890364 RepID=A0A2P6MW65_9EUKA|nr:hypothetical protein PROFUN_01668 [Planoprotostelium fungivorum]
MDEELNTTKDDDREVEVKGRKNTVLQKDHLTRFQMVSRDSSRLRIPITSPMRVVNGNNFPLSDEEEEDEDQSDLTVTPKKKNIQHLKKSPGEPKKMGTFDAKNQEEYAPPVIALSCIKCKKEMQVDPKEYSMVPSPFDKKYEYECKSCTRSKPTLRHLPKSWTEIALTAAYNLQVTFQKEYFHSKLDICDYVDKNWDVICQGKTSESQIRYPLTFPGTATWWATLHAQITQNKHLFKTAAFGSGYWGICYENHKDRANINRYKRKEKLVPSEPKQEVLQTSDNQPVYKVEAIMGKRIREGETEYLLKWMGYSHHDNTWEREEHIFTRELVSTFEQMLKEKNIVLNEERTEILLPQPPPSTTDVHKRKRVRPITNLRSLEGDQLIVPDQTNGTGPPKTCHHCRSKKPNLFTCSKTACERNYCGDCLSKSYKMSPVKIATYTAWECPFSKGNCRCITCRRESGEEIEETALPNEESPDVNNDKTPKKKRDPSQTPLRRSASEHDLDDFASCSSIYTGPPKRKDSDPITIPSWREVKEEEIVSGVDSSDEDTSDEFYVKMHLTRVKEYTEMYAHRDTKKQKTPEGPTSPRENNQLQTSPSTPMRGRKRADSTT